jgi:hypothetical protein
MNVKQLYRWKLIVAALGYLLLTPSVAQDIPQAEQESPALKRSRRFSLKIGPELSLYRAGTAQIANRFGSQWTVFGLGLGSVEKVKTGTQADTDINFFFGNSGNNRATLIPAQVGARYGLRLGRDVVAYTGVYGGYSAINVRSEPDNVRSGWRFTPLGSVVAGINLNQRAYAEVRYYRFGSVNRFNFSGTSYSIGLRF